MNRTPSALSPARHRAFTLVEIIVVMGIIVLLVSILLPLVMRSYRQAGRIRAQADLQTVTTGLEAYKLDFGDIPRPGNDLYSKNHGAALLGKALLGTYGDGKNGVADDPTDPPTYQTMAAYSPGDAFRNSAGTYFYVTLVPIPEGAGISETDTSCFAQFDPRDGADGPGFRKRAGGAGPVSPPYLQAGKIASRGTYLLDHYGNPIYYFPASVKKRDLTLSASSKHQPYVDFLDYPPSGVIEPRPTYSADDNIEAFFRRGGDGKRLASETDTIALNRMRIMLGDFNANGYIDATTGTETPVTASYLLWTAGPDGLIGLTGVDIPNAPTAQDADNFRLLVPKSDDIVNFRQ